MATLIQVPRLYDIYKSNKLVNSFEEILDNLFRPLFEVTLVNDNIICILIIQAVRAFYFWFCAVFEVCYISQSLCSGPTAGLAT